MVDPSLKEEAAAAGRFTGARLFARQASRHVHGCRGVCFIAACSCWLTVSLQPTGANPRGMVYPSPPPTCRMLPPITVPACSDPERVWGAVRAAKGGWLRPHAAAAHELHPPGHAKGVFGLRQAELCDRMVAWGACLPGWASRGGTRLPACLPHVSPFGSGSQHDILHEICSAG